MPAAVNPQSPESLLSTAQGGFLARSSRSLPGDILESARLRVRTACLVVAGLWFYVFIMNQVVYPLLGKPVLTNGSTWSTGQSVLIVVGLVHSLATAWWVNTMKN